MIEPSRRRTLDLRRPLDLRSTLGPLRFGKGDPTMLLRFDEAFRTTRAPTGPATLHVLHRGHQLLAESWGDGAEWVLDQLPRLIGEDDDADFDPPHALVRDLLVRTPGLRFGRTERVYESLVRTICAQQASNFEGKRSYRQVLRHFGEPAPGPPQLDLVVAPRPGDLASAGHQTLHLLGLERHRGDIVRRIGARAASLEAVVAIDPEDPAEAERRLRAIAGVGVWASAMVRQLALGDADAVPVGDPELRNIVAYAFTGRRHGTDAEMLELLEPFTGHRGRVLRLLRFAGLGPPPASDA